MTAEHKLHYIKGIFQLKINLNKTLNQKDMLDIISIIEDDVSEIEKNYALYSHSFESMEEFI